MSLALENAVSLAVQYKANEENTLVNYQ